MNLPVRLRSAAETDVSELARYLAEQNAQAGLQFLDAVDATIALLGSAPGIGGSCCFKNRLFDGIRVWTIAGFKNYLVFYRVLSDEIEIVRVIHGARDIGSIFGEDKP